MRAASTDTLSLSEKSETATVIPAATEEAVLPQDSKPTPDRFQFYPPTSRETITRETTSRKRPFHTTALTVGDQFCFRSKVTSQKPAIQETITQGNTSRETAPRVQFRPDTYNIQTTPVVKSQFRFRPEYLLPPKFVPPRDTSDNINLGNVVSSAQSTVKTSQPRTDRAQFHPVLSNICSETVSPAPYSVPFGFRDSGSDSSPMEHPDPHGFRGYSIPLLDRGTTSQPPLTGPPAQRQSREVVDREPESYTGIQPEKPVKFGGEKGEDVDDFLIAMEMYLRSMRMPKGTIAEIEQYKLVLL